MAEIIHFGTRVVSRYILPACALFLLGLIPLCMAQTTAGGVQQRHDALAKMQEALTDPDPLTRLANMEALVASGDATAIYLAMRTAFSSDDPAMQNLAMRTWVASLKRFTVDIVLPGDLQKQVDDAMLDPKKGDVLANNKWLSAWMSLGMQATFGFTEVDVSKNTGKVYSIPGETPQSASDFTISGTQIVMTVSERFAGSAYGVACNFRLSPTAKLTLQGTVSCSFGYPSPRLAVSGPML